MKTTTALTLLALVLFCTSTQAATISFGSGAEQFTMEFVFIGNAGNAPDTTGTPNPAGAVNYAYDIGKYEVSRESVVKANNAAGLEIKEHVGSSQNAHPLRPAEVSWNGAARFVNWLNTSHGFMPAYKFATQPGDVNYDSDLESNLLWVNGDAGFDAANPYRNSLARFFLPTDNEWYKAAYFDPNANDGAGGYWNFATGSDATPLAVSEGTAVGTAVYDQHGGNADAAGFMWAGGLSPYGTMAQGGNVGDYVETEADFVNDLSSTLRGARGGHWWDAVANLSSSHRFAVPASNRAGSNGFRVVRIPEPSSLLLAALAGVSVAVRRRTSRHDDELSSSQGGIAGGCGTNK